MIRAAATSPPTAPCSFLFGGFRECSWLYDRPAPPIFAVEKGGFLQLPSAPLSSCCHYPLPQCDIVLARRPFSNLPSPSRLRVRLQWPLICRDDFCIRLRNANIGGRWIEIT